MKANGIIQWVLFILTGIFIKKGTLDRDMHNGRWCERQEKTVIYRSRRAVWKQIPYQRTPTLPTFSFWDFQPAELWKWISVAEATQFAGLLSITAALTNYLKWWGLAWDAGLWQQQLTNGQADTGLPKVQGFPRRQSLECSWHENPATSLVYEWALRPWGAGHVLALFRNIQQQSYDPVMRSMIHKFN